MKHHIDRNIFAVEGQRMFADRIIITLVSHRADRIFYGLPVVPVKEDADSGINPRADNCVA